MSDRLDAIRERIDSKYANVNRGTEQAHGDAVWLLDTIERLEAELEQLKGRGTHERDPEILCWCGAFHVTIVLDGRESNSVWLTDYLRKRGFENTENLIPPETCCDTGACEA